MTPEEKISLDEMRLEVDRARRMRDYGRVLMLQVEIVNRTQNTPVHYRELKNMGCYLFEMGDMEKAEGVFAHAVRVNPQDDESMVNRGLCLANLRRYHEAIEVLEPVVAIRPRCTNCRDALTRAYGYARLNEKARALGEESLRIKDENAALKNYRHHDVPLPRFTFLEPSRHIIAFSLWGDNPRYHHGARRNAKLAPDIYPGWTCRFYVDNTLPVERCRELEKFGAQIVVRPVPSEPFERLYWRFEVADDPEVKRYLVRDCDSVINTQERMAVDEWLQSDRHFHVMRDFCTHSEIVLAGLWGGVYGALPRMRSMYEKYHSMTPPSKTSDQIFLREVVWPYMRTSCLIHDSWFRVLGAKPFPSIGRLPPGKHVGQDEWTVLEAMKKPITGRIDLTKKARQ